MFESMQRLLFSWFILASLTGLSQSSARLHIPDPATVREYEKAFTTYPFSDPSPVPLLTNVYPYFRYDGFTTKPIDKKWKVVELENDYIRLLILPEIGGKVWAAIEKSTNKPFLYFNHVVKFRDIAMRGPWTSGGLEANYGIIGHTPNCATPVDYLTVNNADGSVSCFIGALDLLSRSYWRVEINLPRDKAFFSTRSFWYNTTPIDQPYYHWMNAGLKAGGDLEFIYPGNKYLGHNGEYGSWPVDTSNGKKIAFYNENDYGTYKSYHVFGKYTDFAGAYWHQDSLGMVRYGTHDDKAGKKIWIWGLSRQGMIWEHLLSDTDGQYVELQSGRLFNQNTEKSSLTPFKHQSLTPYESDSWKEYWYPVLRTRGIVSATEYGALNIVPSAQQLKIYFSPVQAFRDTLRIRCAGQLVYERLIEANPLKTFTDSVSFKGTVDSLTALLGPQLLSWSAAPTAGDLSRPVDAPAGFAWSSPYGYYLLACEEMDQKDYPAAGRSLDSSLQKDPWFFPALVKSAELCYRNLDYHRALDFARRAISINTEDGAGNFIYGLVNMQLGNNTDAKDGFDIASLTPGWRSAAYTCLARLYLRENNLLRAGSCAAKALTSQPQNVDALQLQAVITRLQGDTVLYNSSLRALLTEDPLNHFARYEAQGAAFSTLVRNELPQETFLELGIWYANCNQTADAIRILRMSPPVAEVRIWLAWLTHQPIDTARLDPVRSFPFRSETADVLEQLLPATPSWFLRYQLALIYHDRGRLADARRLVTGLEPGYAPFYAFRAALTGEASGSGSAGVDTAAIRRDLSQALQLDPQWRYVKLLTEFELKHGNPVRAQQLAADYFTHHPEDYIIGTLYARTLVANGHYAICVALLRRLTIIPFEGATFGRELYREALLMQAVEQIKIHQYKRALSLISEAKQWPENLGVGAPYLQDQDLYVEDRLTYACYIALHREAEAAAVHQRLKDRHPGSEKNPVNIRILAVFGEQD